MIISKLNDLLPRHPLKTPLALILLTLKVLYLVIGRYGSIQCVSALVFTGESHVEYERGYEIQCGESQSSGVTALEPEAGQKCINGSLRMTYRGASWVR